MFWSLFYIIQTLIKKETLGKEYELIPILGVGVLRGAEYHLWFIYMIIGIYLFVPIMLTWIQKTRKIGLIYFLVLCGA